MRKDEERILLISDLHLEDRRPDITDALMKFLRHERGRCSALYVLGDLFEVWIGDDEQAPLHVQVAAALAEFAQAGSEVLLMHGNRDFLIGPEYAGQCGATLLAEPARIETAAGPVILLHGDTLCTDDVNYQQFREMVRQPEWQQTFLGKPLPERREFARQAREQSQEATADKEQSIMDVNELAVARVFADHDTSLLIHGHTHRPGIHRVDLGPDEADRQPTRMVLGDWDRRLWHGEINAGEIRLEHQDLC